MSAMDKKENRLKLVEDHIGKCLAESEASGELRRARDWGKPLDLGDGYDETPAELRMGFKVLKDAGVVPPEVEMMQRLREMRARLAALDPQGAEAAALGKEIHDLQITVALRIEALAKNR
jgi:hypothetical protein